MHTRNNAAFERFDDVVQDQVVGPMIAAPPQQWPVEQGDETARLLGWLGADGGPDATLEAALLMTLRFVAGLLIETSEQRIVLICGADPALVDHSDGCFEVGRPMNDDRGLPEQ